MLTVRPSELGAAVLEEWKVVQAHIFYVAAVSIFWTILYYLDDFGRFCPDHGCHDRIFGPDLSGLSRPAPSGPALTAIFVP